MIGCLPTQALAFLAVFVYATKAITFELKPGLTVEDSVVIDRLITTLECSEKSQQSRRHWLARLQLSFSLSLSLWWMVGDQLDLRASIVALLYAATVKHFVVICVTWSITLNVVATYVKRNPQSRRQRIVQTNERFATWLHRAWKLNLNTSIRQSAVKPGFHYPSWRPELTGDRFPLPVNTCRVDGRAFPLAELTGRQQGPCWRVMEPVTRQLGPLTRAVNSGSGNRALDWHNSQLRYQNTIL